MVKYSRKMEELFKKIGFDNYEEMLGPATSQSCLSEDLFFFRTVIKATDPFNITGRNMHVLFSIVRPGNTEEYYFQNIFARLDKTHDGLRDPTVEMDYWPGIKDNPPNKKTLMDDLKRMAQLDLVKKRFSLGKLATLNPRKGKRIIPH